ncbi:tripartite tricarboxylate transporter TctB family protein [Methylobacterium sp. SD274]|uniref:tripartite tricarboxylate transporter TctB family protein n=1 Tax=Methylobacterium sp. SD274 TaxID=2782009 RepID=UPI001A95ABFE|nr:tripartite tricarboxylate transporter TctB family protein [Methylobacterium sp. SD274]MBO1019311.1 tripartite tricarboxylate transporter TctB family protein [Methylobacterium sp. SD274]
MSDASDGVRRTRSIVPAPQSFVAGIALVLLGMFGIWAASDLPRGTLGSMGPGMLPHWVAIGVAICGGVLAATGLVREGAGLQTFGLRGPVTVVLAILAFAVTIRPFSLGPVAGPGLGLIVAGPLAVIIGGYATPEARFRELLILALLLTAGCMLLFGDLLNLPIPIFPTVLIEAASGTIPSRVMLRLGAGALALAGLGLLAMQRRSTHRGRIDVAPHTMST